MLKSFRGAETPRPEEATRETRLPALLAKFGRIIRVTGLAGAMLMHPESSSAKDKGAAEIQKIEMTAGENEKIRVEVKLDPTLVYRGEELSFIQDGKKVCLTGTGAKGACPQHFVGAVRGVTYLFRGKLPSGAKLRERVTLTGQSKGLPEREVLDFAVPIVRGVASDLQAWGYDEDGLSETEAKANREEFLKSWREFRQEMFLGDSGDKPFAVLVWRHTANSIEVAPESRAGTARQDLTGEQQQAINQAK
jgi:hypothetical protein